MERRLDWLHCKKRPLPYHRRTDGRTAMRVLQVLPPGRDSSVCASVSPSPPLSPPTSTVILKEQREYTQRVPERVREERRQDARDGRIARMLLFPRAHIPSTSSPSTWILPFCHTPEPFDRRALARPDISPVTIPVSQRSWIL